MYEYTKEEILLRVDNVSLSFGEKKILREVNLTIHDIKRSGVNQGQVVGLLGPSGIGKTQLFRIIAGLQKPTSGQVLIGEKGIPVQVGQVGVVAQHYPLFKHRNVLDNIIVAGKQANMSGAQAKEKAIELLRRFNLESHAVYFPVQLSGGQRQRVAIAQQLICSENFLLMDEPFSGLDPLMKDEVCKRIIQVSTMDERNTIIVTTHDIPTVIEVADTLVVLGFERDAANNIIPGARVRAVYDLIQEELAWRPDIKDLPKFTQVVREVSELFKSLK